MDPTQSNQSVARPYLDEISPSSQQAEPFEPKESSHEDNKPIFYLPNGNEPKQSCQLEQQKNGLQTESKDQQQLKDKVKDKEISVEGQVYEGTSKCEKASEKPQQFQFDEFDISRINEQSELKNQLKDSFVIGEDQYDPDLEDDSEDEDEDEEEEEEEEEEDEEDEDEDDEDQNYYYYDQGEEDDLFDPEELSDQDVYTTREDPYYNNNYQSDDQLEEDYYKEQKVVRQIFGKQPDKPLTQAQVWIGKYQMQRMLFDQEDARIKYLMAKGPKDLRKNTQLQITKEIIARDTLKFFNARYLSYLALKGGRKRKQVQKEKQEIQNGQQAQQNNSAEISGQEQGLGDVKNKTDNDQDNSKGFKPPKPSKRVVFREVINMKPFKEQEQASLINETEQYIEDINHMQKLPSVKKMLPKGDLLQLGQAALQNNIILFKNESQFEKMKKDEQHCQRGEDTPDEQEEESKINFWKPEQEKSDIPDEFDRKAEKNIEMKTQIRQQSLKDTQPAEKMKSELKLSREPTQSLQVNNEHLEATPNKYQSPPEQHFE